MPAVTALHVVPVKGLAAVPRQQVTLEHDGVPEDRRLFLLRENGSVATIRQVPALAVIASELDLEAGTLSVTPPDGRTATTALADVAEPLEAELYGRVRAGRRLPGAVEDAVSAHAGERLRLVLGTRTGVGWDEGPVSLVTRASAQAIGVPQLRRLRMLVEFEGESAYEEDSWVGQEVKLGDALVRVEFPLQRCVVINTSPDTADRDWDGVRRLVEARGRDLVCLGVIASVVRPGEIRVGDRVGPRMT